MALSVGLLSTISLVSSALSATAYVIVFAIKGRAFRRYTTIGAICTTGLLLQLGFLLQRELGAHFINGLWAVTLTIICSLALFVEALRDRGPE